MEFRAELRLLGECPICKQFDSIFGTKEESKHRTKVSSLQCMNPDCRTPFSEAESLVNRLGLRRMSLNVGSMSIELVEPKKYEMYMGREISSMLDKLMASKFGLVASRDFFNCSDFVGILLRPERWTNGQEPEKVIDFLRVFFTRLFFDKEMIAIFSKIIISPKDQVVALAVIHSLIFSAIEKAGGRELALQVFAS